MLAFLDAFALACLGLELANFGFSLAAWRSSALEFVYRRVDQWLRYRLQQLAWLSCDYLAIRMVVSAWQSDAFSFWQAFTVSSVLVLLCCALFFPLSFAWGLLIVPWCERRPIGHSLDRCLPTHAGLSESWQDVRNEYLAAAKHFGALPSIDQILNDISIIDDATPPKARWTTLFLRYGGRDFPATMRHFPILAKLMDSPRIVVALFSCLEPGVELKPHRGYFKGVLRYHLCLEVQDRELVWLMVGGQRYHWNSGEAIVFDDAYVHTAHNRSGHSRVVLFLDVLRPLPWGLDAINRGIAAYAGLHPFSAVLELKVNHWAARAHPDESLQCPLSVRPPQP